MQQLYGNQTLVSSVIVTQCYMFLTLAYILFAAREGSQHSLPKPSSRSATRSSGMFQFTACSKIRKLLNFKWDSLCFKQSRRLKNSNNGSDNYALALSRLWYHKNHLGTGGSKDRGTFSLVMQQLYGNQTLVSSVIVTQCYMFLILAYILFAAREGSKHSLSKPSSRSSTRSRGMFQFTVVKSENSLTLSETRSVSNRAGGWRIATMAVIIML